MKDQIEKAQKEVETWAIEKRSNVRLEGSCIYTNSNIVVKRHRLWNLDFEINLQFASNDNHGIPLVDETGHIQRAAIHAIYAKQSMLLLDIHLNEYLILDGNLTLFGESVSVFEHLDQDFVAYVKIVGWRKGDNVWPFIEHKIDCEHLTDAHCKLHNAGCTYPKCEELI